jgi:hypothetical protein
MRTCLLVVCCAILGGVSAGCGDSGPRKYDVSGKVSWDGNPIPVGDIMFVPEAADVAREAGKIKDGAYHLKAFAGKYKVEIRATREVPGKKGPMGEQAIEDYIPEKYNAQTILNADVGPNKREFDFSLKPD